MNKPYIYLAVSKKVPKHRVEQLMTILHTDFNVPYSRINMHERGLPYNASKAENAALVIGVTHNTPFDFDHEISKFYFPKGSYGELRKAISRNDKYHYIYDFHSKDFFYIEDKTDFSVNDSDDWSHKYGKILGVKDNNYFTKSINENILNMKKSSNGYHPDIQKALEDGKKSKSEEKIKSNRNLLLL